MSNRLESLNSKKSSNNSKPSLRFKPKVVARKTKEERDKEAPITVKHEPTDHRPILRGRGSTRGGRGGRGNHNSYAGTHLVLSGPLSAGSVSMNDPKAMTKQKDKVFDTVNSKPDFIQKLKENSSLHLSADGDSDKNEDLSSIDMSKEYKFAKEDTLMFPVRPLRTEENISLPNGTERQYSGSPSVERTASVEKSSSPEILLKDEPIEEKLEQIKEHKQYLESKITQNDDQLGLEDSEKLSNDHKDIYSLLGKQMNKLKTEDSGFQGDDRYFLFQLPETLPLYTPINKKHDAELSKLTSPNVQEIDGQIGFMNIYKSGKISIDLGNKTSLSVKKGLESDVMQDLVMVNISDKEGDDEILNDEGKAIQGDVLHVGEVDSKIIATPSII